MARRSENQERIYDIIKRYRCRRVDLWTNFSSASYNHVIEHSIRPTDLKRRTGISKQTISNVIRKLYDDHKILAFRFKPNGEYISEPFGENNPPSTVLRLAVPVDEDSFVGEDILDELGVRLVGSPDTLRFFSASAAQQNIETENFRLHFVTGGYLVTLSIDKSLLERFGQQPLIIFIGQAVRIFKKNSLKVFKDENSKKPEIHDRLFLPEQSHLESLGENCVYLGIPDNSLRAPYYWPGSMKLVMKNPKLKRLFPRPSPGGVALTIYPDMRVCGLSVINDFYNPKVYKVEANDLLEEVLDYPSYLNLGIPWPTQYRPGVGNGSVPFDFEELKLFQKTATLSNEMSPSEFWKTRPFPTTFTKNTWLKLERHFLDYNKEDMKKMNIETSFIVDTHNHNENPSTDLIRNFFEAYTTKISTPSIINFRNFSLLLTSKL